MKKVKKRNSSKMVQQATPDPFWLYSKKHISDDMNWPPRSCELLPLDFFCQVMRRIVAMLIILTLMTTWKPTSLKLLAMSAVRQEAVERTDEVSLIIERILVLIRNILYVPADRTLKRRPDNDANDHDQVLWAMHQSGILDILLYIASSTNEQTYHAHVLEILSHLLKEQNPTELGKTELNRNYAEKVKDEAELLAIRHKETIKRQQKAKLYSGARHSRFGGTFVVKSMKSISDNDLIYHKPLSRLDALSFDAEKQKPRTPRNRLPIHMEPVERRSAFSIRLFLKEFCVEFLKGAYNTLMYQVKDQLVRSKSHNHDASYYLWAIRFFMEFNRAHKFEVKLVSETLSVQTFHYVQQHMENFFDMIQSDKKKLRAWSRRLHIALLAYRELLLTLCYMDKSPDGTVRDSSKVIKSNIFYVLEYRELVLTLLLTFDELKMSDQYLKDLMETQHIFLRSFEAFCKDGSVIVQTKSKAKRKKKKAPPVQVPLEVSLQNRWDEASQYLATVLEGNNIPTDVVPFDATSDVPIDEQKSETMVKIQKQLRCGEHENAIGLLRAAREVWPENDSFGSQGMSPEEEFAALRDIFLADLGENDELVQPQPVYDENDEEEEEDEDGGINFSENDIKFEDFCKRLSHPKIVRATALALSMFEENSVNTNHCIVKLMHRIAFDCKMYAMMYQVSLFMTFKRIMDLKGMPEYKELVKFVTYILRQFFKAAETNKKIFMEALFWKSSKDAYDVEYGYGSYQEKANSNVRVWTEEDEDEVRRLFMEHKEKQLEDDVVDWVLENLIDNTRSRRALLKKMKELYLLTDYKKGNARKSAKVPKHWSPEEEDQLTELYEQFKDAMDPLGCIMDRLNVSRSKNRIIEKLLVLGLIQDRKEVRKKRTKGASRPRSGPRNAESDRSDGSSGSDDDDDSDGPSTSIARRADVGSKKKNTKRTTVVNVSSKRLAELILGVAGSGMNESLDWLKESFSDAIEDFDEEADEGIPLVPIMDYSVTAMENPDFQNMLQAMGISKPSNEQETYWRIPSNLPLDTLKILLDLLSKALEGNLTIPEEDVHIAVGQQDISQIEQNEESPPNTAETAGNNSEESDDEDVFELIRKSNNRTLEQPSTSSTNENKRRRPSSSEDDENQIKTVKKRKNTIHRSNDIVDSEDDDVTNGEEITQKKPKRRVFIDESSNESNAQNLEELHNSSSDEDIFEKLKKMSDGNQEDKSAEEKQSKSVKLSKKRRTSNSNDISYDNNEDLLAMAEEKLKNERKKKKDAKTSKKDGSKKTKKGENSKLEQKTSKKAPPKKVDTMVYKSKEFISESEESSDDGESERKLKDHYEQLLQKDIEELAAKKAILSKNNNDENDSDLDTSENANSKSNKKKLVSGESNTDDTSDDEESNKEHTSSNKTKKSARKIMETDEEE
ncbi:protein timeless homolog isoform X2 [Harmonia axyridis]|uniref:protein timeless homolog isoform X2 n=1 Tax=Harmonia axyridis TaxID=115357 RepID=UPI001E275718|nr:protein timeless homolog isoform X2 [Harmonia axyridis]